MSARTPSQQTLRLTPSMANTPLRAIRVPDEVWQAAREKAEREGTTVTAVVLAALQRYVKRP